MGCPEIQDLQTYLCTISAQEKCSMGSPSQAMGVGMPGALEIQGGEGGNRGWDSWMASLTQWTWVWANFRRGEGQGSLVCAVLRIANSQTWLNNWTTTTTTMEDKKY